MRKRLKRLLWQWRLVWITAPSMTILVILMRSVCLLQPWELSVFDQYMRLRPLEPPDDRIAIVGIDEEDIKECCFIQSGDLAQLLKKLKAHQPKVIGVNIYAHLLGSSGYQELVQVIKSTPNLVVTKRVIGGKLRLAVAPPDEVKANLQVGMSNLIQDADNRMRRGLLYMSMPNGQTVNSFSLSVALRYLNTEGIALNRVEGMKFRLGKAEFHPFKGNDGGYVEANTSGYQTILNYRRLKGHFNTVSMRDILQDRVPPEWGKGRIILIGTVGESFQDLVLTPYSGGLHRLPVPIPGVEVHAHLTSQILSAAMDSRPLIQSWSEPLDWLWILLWSGIGATLAWKLRSAGGMGGKSFYIRGVICLLAGGALLISTYTAFLWGWWLPVVPPLLALSGSALTIAVFIARTAGEIRNTFGRYLSDEIVANLLESPKGMELGGERRKITILTSDLRGFTATSEQLPPEEVIKILNLYLEYMADVITKYQGTIDEFMGDGILVLFGAPTAREDDAKRAVACAVAMQLAMTPVNEKMKEWGLPPLEMGIGINTGEVVVGNIGSEKRAKYGIVGSQVNLTYRIESYTLGGQIIISEPTLKEAGSIVRINGQRDVQPKGVKQAIAIYEVGGINGEYNLFLSKDEEVLLPLTEPIPIQYTILDGKHVGDTLFTGSLVKLSAKEAQVRCDKVGEYSVPLGLSNIKLNLLSPNNQPEVSEDIYAKVLEKPADNETFYIHFTSKPPAVRERLDALYDSLKRRL